MTGDVGVPHDVLMDSEPEHLALPDWVQAEARMMVAEFLDREHFVRRLDALMPRDGGEFEEALVDRELALMADGVAPTEIAFRLAVVRATRDALMLQSSIRALPTGDGRLPPKREHLRVTVASCLLRCLHEAAGALGSRSGAAGRDGRALASNFDRVLAQRRDCEHLPRTPGYVFRRRRCRGCTGLCTERRLECDARARSARSAPIGRSEIASRRHRHATPARSPSAR